ncbi:MAG: helix-turn-helix domain-containing protein [Myxococcota bacterium]|nr:helix-turn-helix domain-containing protein [Myxococcota bacterium]
MTAPRPPARSPARARRPRARGRATRARLLEAAGELFRRRGYDGTSVVDVAARAGVGVGTVYHHFADKRAMLLALIDDWADRVEARRRSELDLERFLGDDPRGAIRRWLRRAYEREHKEPSLYVVVLGLADRDEEVRRRYHRLEQGAIARLHELVAFGQRRGVMRPDLDAEAVAFLVHHAIDMAATQLLVREVASPDADRVLEALADMIARTLLEDDR